MPTYAATSTEILEKMKAGWAMSFMAGAPALAVLQPPPDRHKERWRYCHAGSVAALLKSGKLVRTASGTQLGEVVVR